MRKALSFCLISLNLCIWGCSSHQPPPGPQGTAYGPLGFVSQENGTYLKPPPTAIDINLKQMGALQKEQLQGDRTYVGWGMCAIRNE